MIHKLSPSRLNLFLDCTRCFWLENIKGIFRPDGVFPSLPSGMDIAIKAHFDRFRKLGELPPEIKGKVVGKLLGDEELITKMRDWKTFSFEDKEMGVIFRGGLDDCLVHESAHIPIDFKTRGFKLEEDSSGYYQNQLDCYALLLEKNGFKQPGFAYLVYYIVKEVKKNGAVKFDIRVVKIDTDSKRAMDLLRKAVEVLNGPMPEPSDECEFCRWRNERI